jgi:hypothetical protein
MGYPAYFPMFTNEEQRLSKRKHLLYQMSEHNLMKEKTAYSKTNIST